MKIRCAAAATASGMGAEGSAREARANTYFRIVSPNYFSTMRIRLRARRTFDARTGRSIGQHGEMRWSSTRRSRASTSRAERVGATWRRFDAPRASSGVVADVAEGALSDEPKPTRTSSAGRRPGSVTARRSCSAPAHPQDARRARRGAAHRAARRARLAVQETTTMSRVMDVRSGPARQIMVLLSLLSALALVLGAVGIYG
jgi:hypothetical protein